MVLVVQGVIMDVLKSLSAFFSNLPTPTKRRQEPSPPATIEDLRHWLDGRESMLLKHHIRDVLFVFGGRARG